MAEAPIWFVEEADGAFVLDDVTSTDEAADDFEAAAPDGTQETDPASGPVRGNPLGRSGSGNQGLFDLIPTEVLALFVGLVAASVLYAMAKARRLGSPVTEEVPIKLPSSSFVDALGRLYRRAENPEARSAAIMRENLRTTLTRRVGMRTDTPAAVIAESLGTVDGQQTLVRLLDGPPPTEDGEFVELARNLAETRHNIEHHGVAHLGIDPTKTAQGRSSAASVPSKGPTT